jgi:diaminohydroxyphosphoribosylaminopyrimidine deaminase/5-amino-6-(5-phosphoribosylamino)uracil reductase
MARALELALHGLETTTPNPRVGCVLVRDGNVVGEGWHQRAGEAHAEVHALRHAGDRAAGSTAYVTLEPCSHTGRTGPCCEALIEAGVRRVFAAMQDPNPLVAGRGIARLRAQGIEVHVGLQAAEARALNPGFVARMTRGRPWVRVKVGMSLDGRTALANGVSQWITSPEARADVHRLRARSCAVLTGLGTLRADDPQLSVRAVPASRQPLRVLIDSFLEAPAAAHLLVDGHTLVLALDSVLGNDDPPDTAQRAGMPQGQGVRRIGVPADPANPRHLDLRRALERLAAERLNEVLVEAGAGLNGALLAAGLVDECVFYLAPALLGDGARGPARLGPWTALADRLQLQFSEVVRVGPDLRITAIPAQGGARLPG